jgi:tRNA pseudouridine38-40 synthase
MDQHNRYFVRLAYNGARYLGWQLQKQSPTVQEVVNEGLSRILRQEINVTGCGRTDTGVHARSFYAHFDLPAALSRPELSRVVKKLNGYLPRDITIFDILPVRTDANARFSAIKRTYKYQVNTYKDPFRTDSAYAYFSKLDVAKMNAAANLLFDYTDYTSFSKVNTQVKTNNCKIMEARWEQDGNLLVFTITADRFLRNMVRAIVGTFLDVGRGKLSLAGLREVIESMDRGNAGYSVPPHGLYLHAVEYPAEVFLDSDFPQKNIDIK